MVIKRSSSIYQKRCDQTYWLVTIASRQVTYDLARLMTPPVEPPLKCSEFAQAIIDNFN